MSPWRGRSAFAVLAAALLVGALGGASSEPARASRTDTIRITFVGDSISASLDYVATARRKLSRGWRVHFELAVCRRLVAASCAFQGQAPPTALETVKALGESLGDVLIVNVGYNEGSYGYREGMRRVLKAAFAQEAQGVVWVTLREANPVYRPTNAAIRREAGRWDGVEVADWEAYSRGRPWFRGDGLHLNSAGANGLAKLLRASVQRVS